MNYEEKYNEALERAKSFQEKYGGDYAGYIFPELAESEDERIRKEIVSIVQSYRDSCISEGSHKFDDCLAWLEKQKEIPEKEYVFRPLAGTDITIAAEQAIRRANEGDRLVLAFNGWYVPVDKHATTKGLVDSYDTFIEKQKDLDKMIVVSPEVWDKAIDDAYENGKKDGEKQKENPKSADSISSDCVSDAKCEDRWHKVTDSLPDNGRLVLAKDCLGNVLLARYDGENWEVNVYDNEDHYCHNSISKWCEIPSEKQKEQKSIIQDVELNDAVYDYVRDHFIAGADFTPEYIKKLMENAFFAGVDYYLLKQESESCEPDTNVEKVIEDVIRVYGKTQGEWVGGYDVDTLIVNLRRSFNKKEQKPEWSEEDEKAINDACCFIEEYAGYIKGIDRKKSSMLFRIVDKLKSLRPQKLDASKLENFDPVDVLNRIKTEWPMAWEKAVGKQEWDEFDEDCLKRAIWYVENPAPSVVKDTNLALWLKSLPERKNLPPKQEWNKEDERMLKWIEDILLIADDDLSDKLNGRVSPITDSAYSSMKLCIAKCRSWLKSLHPSWKPSEEQMEALNVLNLHGDLSYVGQQNQLISLYNDLKKLM